MLDLDWERSMPIMEVKIDEIKEIFSEYDNTLTITDFSAIRLGCRNSNFVVSTNKCKFLFRTTAIGEFNNEKIAYEMVKNKVRVPSLLFSATKHWANIFIYQYIDGISLQKIIFESNLCENSLLEQVAQAAASIHNTPKEKDSDLAEFDVPLFTMWYPYFLDNPTVIARLGQELRERVQRLVLDKQNLLSEIDNFKSFIHCDFRPANMLVDKNKKVFIVDWECASTGHSLGDVGQFFRYRSFFKEAQIELFEQVYNKFANRKLPDNWYELSLFRDLVNPLQILSVNQDTPYRNADLLNIIESSLVYWGY